MAEGRIGKSAKDMRHHEFEVLRPKIQQFIDANPLHQEALRGHEWVYDELTQLYMHHPESFFHSLRVSDIYAIIAQEVAGYQGEDLAVMDRAGLTHDLGKIDTPLAILNKPTALTEDEYEVMRQHVFGSQGRLMHHEDNLVADIVIAHHMFGVNPYPLGLNTSNEELQKKRRLLALSDVADTMLSTRVYQKKAHHPGFVYQTLTSERYGSRNEVDRAISARLIMPQLTKLP